MSAELFAFDLLGLRANALLSLQLPAKVNVVFSTHSSPGDGEWAGSSPLGMRNGP